jgi:glucosamine-6-phosphate deaminase
MQYFKSIEKVATSQGFEQILPSSIRTGPNVKSFKPISAQPIPTTVIDEVSPPLSPKESSPTILSPQPTTSRLLRASSPANEYPVRSVSPDFDLVPDRMADRLPDPGFANRRLTPNPEVQNARQVGVY